MQKNSKIFVAGHNGLVGSALVRNLKKDGFTNILTVEHSELDLIDQSSVKSFFKENNPEYVFLAAAKVGGIYANSTYPAEFVFNNAQIELNIINESWKCGVKKLIFLGSSCIYPKYAPQPMREDSLLSGYLEPANEGYAIAKITGIIMCRSYNKQYGTNYISVMPTNLYGPNDNYHLMNSHVLPALIRKFHEAKTQNSSEITLWGSGNATREFLYSDDLAEACILLMGNYKSSEIVNIGTGVEITIKELASHIKEIVGYKGKINFNMSNLDGPPRKLLDCSKIHNMGWHHKVELIEGLKQTYENFLEIKENKLFLNKFL
jgi:GDP-L-fucose synthase